MVEAHFSFVLVIHNLQQAYITVCCSKELQIRQMISFPPTLWFHHRGFHVLCMMSVMDKSWLTWQYKCVHCFMLTQIWNIMTQNLIKTSKITLLYHQHSCCCNIKRTFKRRCYLYLVLILYFLKLILVQFVQQVFQLTLWCNLSLLNLLHEFVYSTLPSFPIRFLVIIHNSVVREIYGTRLHISKLYFLSNLMGDSSMRNS